MAEADKGVLAPPEPGLEEAGNMPAEALTAELIRRSQTADEPQKEEEPKEEAEEAEPEESESEAEKPEEPESEEAEPEQEEEQHPAEDEAEGSLKLPKEVQQKIEKRIGKLTARAKDAEEKLAKVQQDYEAKLRAIQEQAVQSAPVPIDDSPLGNIKTIDDLQKARQNALQIKRWAEEVIDSEVDEVKVGDKEMTRTEVKRILREAQRDIEENIPQREAYIKRRELAETEAKKVFKWLNDPSSEEYQMAMGELRRRPHLAKDPEALWLTGLALKGLQAMKAEQEAAKKPAPKKVEKPPPVDVEPKVAPSKKAAAVPDRAMTERRKQATVGNLDREAVEQLLLEQELSRSRKQNG